MIATSQFLSLIYPQGISDGMTIELRLDLGRGGIVRSWCDTLDEVVKKAKPFYSEAASIWFGPGLREGRGGRDIDVKAVPCLWIDCDAKCFASGSKEEAEQHLREFRVRPSIIVDTGHGAQGYWLLAGYEDSPQEVRGALRWLHQELSVGLSKHLDPVHNLGRVLRLPNTWNRKDAENPVPCRIVSYTDSRVSLADLPKVYEEPYSDYRPEEFTQGDASVDALIEKAKAGQVSMMVIGGLYEPDLYAHGDRSSLDFYTMRELLKAGLTLGECETVWLGTSLGQREKVQTRVKYRRDTISRAREKNV